MMSLYMPCLLDCVHCLQIGAVAPISTVASCHVVAASAVPWVTGGIGACGPCYSDGSTTLRQSPPRSAVRVGSFTSIPPSPRRVRSTPDSGRSAALQRTDVQGQKQTSRPQQPRHQNDADNQDDNGKRHSDAHKVREFVAPRSDHQRVHRRGNRCHEGR
jgi:hypothetical protein